ncbi:MAG: hypothetical protein WD273_10635 [Trueperaceae bacterium]
MSSFAPTLTRPRSSPWTLLPTVLLAILLIPLAQIPVLAQTSTSTESQSQAAALDLPLNGPRDPALELAHRDVERLQSAVTPWGQVDYSARLNPVFRYRDYAGDGSAGSWTGRLGLSGGIDFVDPPATHARALQSLERARQRSAVMELDRVTDALLAHANLLIEQQQELAARLELQEVAAPVESQEAQGDLELRMAALDYRIALHDLENAQAVVLAHGLSAIAHYEPLRFRLPRVDATSFRDTHGYRMLELALLEAEAELAQARRAPLDDLRLRTSYRNRSMQVDVEGGLVNGTPGATFGFDLPGGVERWEVHVSAQLVLDDTLLQLPRLGQAVEAARTELLAYPQRYSQESDYALTTAAMAKEALDLAEEELVAEGKCVATPAVRTRVYRAWIAYVRAVAAVLELTAGEWEAYFQADGG